MRDYSTDSERIMVTYFLNKILYTTSIHINIALHKGRKKKVNSHKTSIPSTAEN